MDHPGSEDEAFRRQITVASPEQTFSSFGALREWISNSLLLFTQSRQAAASQDTAVATVKAYIESHLSDELDRDTLAAMVYLNADYLSHLFKKDTGSSLINYIIDRRIARSKELLAKGRNEHPRHCHHLRLPEYFVLLPPVQKIDGHDTTAV